MPAAASAAATALPDTDAEPGHSGHQQGLAPGCAEVRGWAGRVWEQERLRLGQLCISVLSHSCRPQNPDEAGEVP